MRIEWPKDVSGYVRRHCPFCGRQFKTPAGPFDALTLQRYVSKGCPHQNEDELVPEPGNLSCVYCRRSAPLDLFVTLSQREYAQRLSRALFEEVRFARLALVHQTLAHNPYPTFIPVTPRDAPPPLDDEPNDMVVVSFACCDLKVKVDREWKGQRHCTRCAAPWRSQPDGGCRGSPDSGASVPANVTPGRTR